MLPKLGTIALRIFWEAFALGAAFLAGSVPTLLLAGAIIWTIVDPGCACFSQKVMLARIQIEQHNQIIYAAGLIVGLVSFLLLRRFKFGLRDLVDLSVAAIVFGGVYFVFAAMFKDLNSVTMFIKVPLDILVPLSVQSGFVIPGLANPLFPWKDAFAFANSWAFMVSATAALVVFFGFGDSFRLVPKMLEPRAQGNAASAVDGPATEA